MIWIVLGVLIFYVLLSLILGAPHDDYAYGFKAGFVAILAFAVLIGAMMLVAYGLNQMAS